MKTSIKLALISMIGLLSVTTGSGGIYNRESPVWYATAPMKVKGFSDALFPEQGVKLDAKNDQGQPQWTMHREWPDGAGLGVPSVDSSSIYLYRVIPSRFATKAAVHMTYDDGIEVWLNDQKIASKPSGSPTDMVLNFQPGDNRLLVKVYNNSAGCGFSFQFNDAPTWPASIDPEALRRVIENLSRKFPDQYSRGAEFLKRLDDLEEKLDEPAFRALDREALLAAPPGMKLGRIMPLGDSITKGAPAGAYRDPLFSLLKKEGYSFSFVGTLDENPTAALTANGQEHHQGHSSMGMDWIRDHVKQFFAANPPDRILLAIGANDIGGATVPELQARMENLVTAIFDLQPNVKLYLASVTPQTGPAMAKITEFNKLIPDIVTDHKAKGHQVIYVSMAALDVSDLGDNVHPNVAGSLKMAEAWHAALTNDSAAELPDIKPLFDYPVRDTCICLGPDNTYYLTGTTGHPTWWETNDGIRVWKSKDLKTWEPLGLVWSFEKNATWQKGNGKQRAIWAPEIHYLKNTFWLAYSVNYGGTGLLRSKTGKAEGPYEDIKTDGPLTDGIDASLFADDDGKVYFVWQNGTIARLKDDMSGLAEKPRTLTPAGIDAQPGRNTRGGQLEPNNAGQVGYEGAFLTKINGRYHLICATLNTDDKPQTHYDCMSASADSIFGPYGNTYLAIPHGGHNMLFKDVQGNWWSTFFGNDPQAPFRERPAILPIHVDANGKIRPGKTP
jgi:lysophospholipase L1-like esterase